MSYCEDYPCCGHTNLDPCSGATTGSPDYCDICGYRHFGDCGDDGPTCGDLDYDDLDDFGNPWCYGCDDYHADTNADAGGEDSFLDSFMESRMMGDY